MKNKKLLLVLAMVVFAAFVVAGCGSTTTDKKDSASTDKKAETTGLIQTFQKSVHYTFFGDMIAKGPEIKSETGEHYGDSCMTCHTATKIVDDKSAKVDDFLPGGKYANQEKEGITCKVCHELKGKNGIELKKTGWDTCGQCHVPGYNPDGTLRDLKIGSEVHHPQAYFINGTEIKGGDVPATPSKVKVAHASVKDYGCQACHIMNGNNHSFMVPGVVVASRTGFGRDKVTVDYAQMKTMFDQKECQSCHSSNAQQVVDNIKKNQEEIGKKQEALAKTKKALEKKYEAQLSETKLDPKTNKQVKKGYADFSDPKIKAYFEGSSYFTYVEADSSKGAHNPEYAKALLEKAEAKYKDAQ